MRQFNEETSVDLKMYLAYCLACNGQLHEAASILAEGKKFIDFSKAVNSSVYAHYYLAVAEYHMVILCILAWKIVYCSFLGKR